MTGWVAIFFFKPKTAYEMRISDWSSDVCSSDLHAHSALHTSQVATRNHGRWLIVDADLETGRTPVHELDGALGLDGGNSAVDILWHNISTVHEAARHVLAVARVALGHHVGWLEPRVGDQIGRASCRERGCNDG